MGRKEDQIKKKNEEWRTKEKKDREQKKTHPWYRKNHDLTKGYKKIWTDDITPENKRLEDYK